MAVELSIVLGQKNEVCSLCATLYDFISYGFTFPIVLMKKPVRLKLILQ